jgi:hypothetical protein
MINILCQDDNVVIPVSKEVIGMIGTINDFFKTIDDWKISDISTDDSFPVEMNSELFKKIVVFCEYHVKNGDVYSNHEDPTFMVDFDKEFIEQFMDVSRKHERLLELYRYGHYLNIMKIRKLVAKKLVDMIFKSNDIRADFGLPKEEENEENEDKNK